MKKLKPLHYYLIFFVIVTCSRLVEKSIPWLYYVLVAVGFVFFFMALKKYFKK
jgi:hypothetical protein